MRQLETVDPKEHAQLVDAEEVVFASDYGDGGPRSPFPV